MSWPHRSIGQKGSAGVRKAVGYNMSSFANSPVNGLLYMTGSLGALPLAPPLPPRTRCMCNSMIKRVTSQRPSTSCHMCLHHRCITAT